MLLHGGLRAAHVVHQHHRVGHLVQVHAHRRPDEEADAGAAAVTRLGELQVSAEVGGENLGSVWYPAIV